MQFLSIKFVSTKTCYPESFCFFFLWNPLPPSQTRPPHPSGPGASRWAPLFIYSFKLILVLKVMKQMAKLIFQCTINLAIYLSCSIFDGTADSMDHPHVFRQAGLSWQVLATAVSLFWPAGQGYEWQIIHEVGSLCISTMWLFNLFLVERALKQELQKW